MSADYSVEMYADIVLTVHFCMLLNLEFFVIHHDIFDDDHEVIVEFTVNISSDYNM